MAIFKFVSNLLCCFKNVFVPPPVAAVTEKARWVASVTVEERSAVDGWQPKLASSAEKARWVPVPAKMIEHIKQ